MRIPGYGAAEVYNDFAEELKHTEADPMCSIHESRCTSRIHSRPKTIAWNDVPGDPHQRNPNAPKFEDRSQEETEWQEQCARETAWKMTRCILKLKEKHKTTVFSLSENWCLPWPSTIEPEEREFVVDLSASMLMISKKDLNSVELETVTTSRSPTTVITANGEVQTHEEATVYVRELDTFLTMKVLEDTPAVLSPGNLCDEQGYSYEWINGQNHISLKSGFVYSVKRKTSYRSWFLVDQRVLPQACLLEHP